MLKGSPLNWKRVWVRIAQVPLHRVTYVGLKLLPLQLAGAQVMPVLNDVAASVALALKVYQTQPMSNHAKRLVIPEQEVVAKGREGLKEYVKANCGTVFHPVGTAAMMPRELGGVVDAQLRVYGTSNLRVVSRRLRPLAAVAHAHYALCRLIYL